MRLDLLEPFALRHHGLITREAALGVGISERTWYRAVGSGAAELLHPGVARLWGSAPSLPQRALAAVLAAGRGAMASHRTAAALWGIERPDDDPLEVLLSSRSRCVSVDDVVVHRPRDLVDLRPVLRDRVPTSNPMRTLLDLGAVDADAVYPAAVAVLAAGLVSPMALKSALMRHARKGRHGVSAFRDALDRLDTDGLPTDSELETVMRDLLTVSRLPPAIFHARVAGYEVDFLVAGSCVVLECDGWTSHGLDRDQFEYDRLRGADLVAAGYAVVHFTWRQVIDTPGLVVGRIRRAIARWAPHLLVEAGSGQDP